MFLHSTINVNFSYSFPLRLLKISPLASHTSPHHTKGQLLHVFWLILFRQIFAQKAPRIVISRSTEVTTLQRTQKDSTYINFHCYARCSNFPQLKPSTFFPVLPGDGPELIAGTWRGSRPSASDQNQFCVGGTTYHYATAIGRGEERYRVGRGSSSIWGGRRRTNVAARIIGPRQSLCRLHG